MPNYNEVDYMNEYWGNTPEQMSNLLAERDMSRRKQKPKSRIKTRKRSRQQMPQIDPIEELKRNIMYADVIGTPGPGMLPISAFPRGVNIPPVKGSVPIGVPIEGLGPEAWALAQRLYEDYQSSKIGNGGVR